MKVGAEFISHTIERLMGIFVWIHRDWGIHLDKQLLISVANNHLEAVKDARSLFKHEPIAPTKPWT